VTSNYASKVIDCGVLQLVATDGARFQRRDVVFGSQGYRCPRYERGSRKYSHESDVFSLGIVIIEVCTGRIQNHTDASSGLSQDFYYEYIVDKRRDLATDIDSSAGKWDTRGIATLCKIALACVDGEPMQRPGASSIVKMLGDIDNQKDIIE
jgi:serine/threonine protein kinase